MLKRLSLIFIGLLLTVQLRAEVLTNESVVEMVKMGLAEEIIQAKISAGPNRFDTSTPALSALQKSKVSAKIIAAMIGAGATGKPQNAAINPYGGENVGSESQFYYGPEDALVRIKPIRVASQFSNRKSWIPVYGAFAEPEVFLFIKGSNSTNELPSGSNPAFRTSLDPLNIRLVKLGLHKRGDRYIVFQGSNSEREIELQSDQDAGGMYVLSIPNQLQSGEYAFLYNPANTSGGFWAGFGQEAGTAVAFDFSVQ